MEDSGSGDTQGVETTIRAQTDDVIVAVLDTRVDIKGAGFLGGGSVCANHVQVTVRLDRALTLAPTATYTISRTTCANRIVRRTLDRRDQTV